MLGLGALFLGFCLKKSGESVRPILPDRTRPIMNLDDAQKRTVADWIAQGQKLSEIQKRLADELAIHLTYMEVRMLVDDLKLIPKDAERVKQVELSGKSAKPGSTVSGPETRPGVSDRA